MQSRQKHPRYPNDRPRWSTQPRSSQHSPPPLSQPWPYWQAAPSAWPQQSSWSPAGSTWWQPPVAAAGQSMWDQGNLGWTGGLPVHFNYSQGYY